MINGPQTRHKWLLLTDFNHRYVLSRFSGVAPEPVQDTPEVAAAKAEFAAAFEEVASRQKRESDPAWTYGYNSPWVLNSRYQPFYYNGIYANTRLAYMGYPGYAYGFYH